ncbi:MAG: polyhydroxyalkanoate depolymerase [Solirubrobacterales bacterium]
MVDVEDRLLLDSPAAILHHYRKPGTPPQPPVLVVAPLSGHFGWLMRDLVLGLAPRHDVHLLEWQDARDIPAAAGRFGLDRSIGCIMDALRRLPRRATVVAVSQAPTAALAAAALMAADAEPMRPRALVLMGGFIDTRINPTPMARMAGALPAGWFSRILATRTAGGQAGDGRLVYPGRYHWQALARYLSRHLATGGELAGKLADDDGADPDAFPFLRLFSTLMDLPAEFAEDNSELVFRRHALARGQLTWAGQPVEPAALEDVALMTVEGGRDDSSGFGQTLAAHALSHRIPDGLREHHIEPEAGHFGLFHGRPWFESILPEVEAFIARVARSRRAPRHRQKV